MEAALDSAEDLLCAEIRNEARRESEAIALRAVLEGEQILVAARREAESSRQARLASAQSEAERQAEQILATVPLEQNRLRAQFCEELLEDIRREAEQRLAAGAGYDPRETLLRLAVEAIEQMPGEAFHLRISPGRADTDTADLATAIANRCHRQPLRIEVMADPAVEDGGLIIEAAAGGHLWDNQLRARLARMWPELRRQLATQAGLIEGGGA